MSHTPGPWLIRKDGTNSGRCAEVYVDGAYYDDGSEFVVADCGTVEVRRNDRWTRTNETPVREANARLIAAAPELLEALKTALSAEETRLYSLPASDDYEVSVAKDGCSARIGRYRAAVAKATGGAQ